MDGNKIDASVHDEQRRVARLVTIPLIGMLVSGLYLGGLMMAHVKAD